MTTLTPAPGSTLLFEGDSLTAFRVGPTLDTWAWSRFTGAHYGFPEKVGDWIFCQRPDLKLQVRNGAIGGSTAADLLERFDRHVAPLKPAVIIMTIGGNDAARGVAPEAAGQTIAAYAERLHALCGGRILHLGGVFPNEDERAEAQDLHRRRTAVWSAVAQAVRAHRGMAIDALSVLSRKHAILKALYAGHTIFHDGVHFNPVGNEMMAAIALRALGLMEVPGEAPLA